MKLKHGMRISCIIEDIEIKDARISIERFYDDWFDDGGKGVLRVYVCQNKLAGGDPDNLFGYDYGWWIGDNPEKLPAYFLKNLKILKYDYNSNIIFKRK